jgi:hypothetical protein
MRCALTRVVYGCMFMTDTTRQRNPESRAPQSCARPIGAGRAALRCGRTVGTGLLHFAAASLSLPRTSSVAETTGPAKRSQTGIHGEASSQSGRARPDVRCRKRIVDQRGGQPSVARAAAAKAGAWVSRNQFGHEPCSWNIDSIVCCRTNSLTRTSCSYQIDVSQSEVRLRKQRIQPRE